MQYRPYVDGLRAVAILPVLAYHGGLRATGGFVGVDIFFVISGFLITGLILKDLDVGQFSIVEFWERRIRRILPALAVVVVASLIAGWFLFLPENFMELGKSGACQATLMANVYFWRGSGYFAKGVEVKPLLHTWSLAVEEQFYLFFPFFLMALARFSRRFLPSAILLLGGISLVISIWGTYAEPDATFYLLPMRGWELLTGAFLASLPPQKSSIRWVSESVTFAGCAAIFYAVFFFNEHTRFPGAAALLPCLGTVAIIWANGHTLTLAGRFLALRPVVFVGLISYSLYLWHWPMLVFAGYQAVDDIPLRYRLLILAASVVLAALSWKFVESPFRKRRLLKTRPRAFAFAAIVMSVLFLSSLGIYLANGLPSRVSPDVLKYANGAEVGAFRINVDVEGARSGKFIEYGKGDPNQPARVLLWGDSHAMAVAPLIDALCKEYSVRGVGATHSATAPLVGYSTYFKSGLGDETIPFADAVVDFVRKNRVSDVIVVGYWFYYDDGTDMLRGRLLATIRKLKETGTKVWIMKVVPRQKCTDMPRALALAAMYDRNPAEMGLPLAEHNREVQYQRKVFEGLDEPGVTILDPTGCFLSPKGTCRAALDGYSLYVDRTHLTIHGAMALRPLFEPIFKRTVKGSGN